MPSPSWVRNRMARIIPQLVFNRKRWSIVGFGLILLLVEAATVIVHASGTPAPGAARASSFLPIVSNITGPVIESQKLPIEVLGANNTIRVVKLDIPAGATKLWLEVYNLSYQNKASLQINTSAWRDLNNTTPGLTIAEPGKRYGGIGGAFHTLKMTIDLDPGSVPAGSTTLRFRFNQTDGLSMGYRVLDLNFLNSQGQRLLTPRALPKDDPATWQPPATSAADIAAGEQLWRTAALKDSPLPEAITLKARCSSCHAQDGRDLKYFNYSNFAITERAKFHGLSATQGAQIASYIRSLNTPNPGRPWNPPFQPGPGLDSKPVAEWSAGAGIDAVLDSDSETQQFIPGNGTDRAALVTGTHFKALNVREIPIAMQLPDWNHWLPRIHPLDIATVGDAFLQSEDYTSYQTIRTALQSQPTVTREAYIASKLRLDLDRWAGGFTHAKTTKPFDIAGPASTKRRSDEIYAYAVWQAVKQWEVMQEFSLEDRGKQFYGANGEARQWYTNRHIFDISPHLLGLLNGFPVVGDGKPTLTNAYFANAWYEVQLQLNPGARSAVTGGHHTIDWGYMAGLFGDSNRASGYGEPMRATVFALKAMQQHDNGVGPEDTWWGWNLRDNSAAMNRSTGDNWAEQPNAKPIIQLTFQIWAEKSATFTTRQWRKTQGIDGVNVPPLTYVLGTDQGEARERNAAEGLANDIRTLRETYQIDEALLGGMADFGKSIWANGGWDALKIVPAASIGVPTNLQATPGVEHVTLTWSAVSGATSYNVKRAETPDGVFRTVAYFVSGTTFTERGLVPGVAAFYKVSANSGRAVGSDSTTASAMAQTGLVSRWTFDETTGTQANDVGEANNAGELIGVPTRVSGQRGQAIQFDGQRQFMGLETSAHRWLATSATVAVWIKTTGTGNDSCAGGMAIMGGRAVGPSTPDADSLWGCLDSKGRIGAQFGYNGASVMSSQPVNDGQWHHIAISRDATNGLIQIYVDGILAQSGMSSVGPMNARFFSVGRVDALRSDMTPTYWPGSLDDLRIYDTILNATEIQQLYRDGGAAQ